MKITNNNTNPTSLSLVPLSLPVSAIDEREGLGVRSKNSGLSILPKLYQHHYLSTQEAYDLIVAIAEEDFSDLQLASILSAFNMRPLHVQELIGFRNALLDLALPIHLSQYQTMDICGTGGDGKNTFNISTTAAFVVAAAGIPVAKHGNYGVSSISGSSNVLEQLGITFTNNSDVLQKQIETTNLCFLHAPLFHPAMKKVAPVRKGMGVKTFFNILGPLVNPAKPIAQTTGVFNLETARLYHYFLQQNPELSYTIIHDLAGYDEVSLTDKVKTFSDKGENLIDWNAHFTPVSEDAIKGGNTLQEAATIFWDILHQNGSKAQNQVVIANAALAIQTYKKCSLQDAIALAEETLLSGKAQQTLTKFIALSK